jgi:HK97 family phage major capsid protein
MKWSSICKALGLADTATLEQVQKAIDEQNAVIKSASGPVDVAAAYKAHTAKPILIEDEVEANDLAVKAATQTKAKADRVEQASQTKLNDDGDAPKFSAAMSVRKAYNVRAAQGLTKLADADSAEQVGAFFRLATFGKAYGGRGYSQEANDQAIVKTQVGFDNTLGGYTVAPELVNQILYLTETGVGVARKLANVVRMGSDVRQYPRKTAIPAMLAVAENGTITEGDVTLDQVRLTAKKFGRILAASNELLEDSAINVADMIASSVRESYDRIIDTCYFNGTGASDTAGIEGLTQALPSAAYINASGAWSAFTTANFNTALGSLENVDSSRIAMVCSRQFYHQVMLRLEKGLNQFKDLAAPGNGNADAMFLGYPVYFAPLMPTATGSAGTRSVYIGDFAAATMIGERRDLAILGSSEAGFTSDSYKWRATTRFDVAIHGDGRGSTIGPVVALLTA